MKKYTKKQLEQNRKKLKREKDKSEYIAKMRYLSDVFGGAGTFDILPPNVVDNAYRMRFLTLKVTADNVKDVSEKDIQKLQHMVNLFSCDKAYQININNRDVLLSDYMSVGLTLHRIIQGCKADSDKEKWAEYFVERVQHIDLNENYLSAIEMCFSMASVILYNNMNIEKEILWFTIHLRKDERTKLFQNTLNLNAHLPEVKYFNVLEGNRKAICVSFCTSRTGLLEAKILLSILGVKTKEKNETVKIYIQQHALRRLDERLDSLERTEIHLSLFSSFLVPEVILQGNNKALIAYKILSSKVGYLVAEYIDGAVLIHTFLFITNNGTPEGKKLYKLTGLSKLDKKYLALDKLSSFIKSDIAKNEKLKTLFEKAGCNCLLEIEEVIQKVATKQADNKNIDLLLRYMNTDNEVFGLEEELVVGSLESEVTNQHPYI